MPKATKLPSGSWRVNLYLGKQGGKEIRRSITGRTKKEAEQAAARYMLENHLDDTPMTVGEAVDKYIKDASATLSPSTIKGYKATTRNYLTGISSYMADRISRDDIQGWINDLSSRCSPKTVRNAYGLVRSAICSVRPGYSLQVKLPTRAAEIILIPTEDDIQKMLDNSSGLLRICIMLGAFGSLRRGEIIYLRYKDIKDGCVHVHGDVISSGNGWIEKDHAKTVKSNRIVRLPEFVIGEIGTGDPDQKIVPHNPDWISKRFLKLMRELDMPYHFHLLRHFFASSLIAQGIPKDYIQALGGWETGGSLDKVYTHIMQTSKNDFNSKVADYFDKFK